jgi:hypothetical protein
MPQPYCADLRECVLAAYEQEREARSLLPAAFACAPPLSAIGSAKPARRAGAAQSPTAAGLPVGWDPIIWRYSRGSWLHSLHVAPKWRS